MFSTIKNPALLKIYVTPFFAMLIDGMTRSISILFAIELGADIFQINLITTIGSTMHIFLEIPFGVLSDRFGRKPMLIYARIMQMSGILLRMFATVPSDLLIASVFGGFAGGEFFPILQSMIGDVAEPRDRREAMSTMFVFSSVGMLLSPVICSSLLTLPQISLRTIYQIMFVGQIFILLYLITQIRETKLKTSESSNQSYRSDLTDLIKQKSFQFLLIVGFLYWFSRSTFNTYIKVYAKVDLNLSNAEVASLDVYSSLATMLIRFLSATLLTRVPFRPTLIAFLTLGGTTVFLSPLVDTYLFMMLLFFLEGISYGATRIMLNVAVANISTPENRGVANSMNQLVQSIAAFMKIFTTPIVNAFGFLPVFILGGITALLSTIPPLLRKLNLDDVESSL